MKQYDGLYFCALQERKMAVRGLRGLQPAALVKEYVDGRRGAHLDLKR